MIVAQNGRHNLEESPWLPRPGWPNGADRMGRKGLPHHAFRSSGEGCVVLAEDVIHQLARLVVEKHDRNNSTT